MRKPVMPYVNNKGAHQPAHPCSLISTCFVCCLDSIIPILANFQTFKALAGLCNLAGWFESNLVTNPQRQVFLRIWHGSYIEQEEAWEKEPVIVPHWMAEHVHLKDHYMSPRMTKPTKWRVPSEYSGQYSLCTQWVAEDPGFLHTEREDSDQTGRMPRLIWVFAGHTRHFAGLSHCGSYQDPISCETSLNEHDKQQRSLVTMGLSNQHHYQKYPKNLDPQKFALTNIKYGQVLKMFWVVVCINKITD